MHIFTVIYVLLSLKFGFIYKDQITILGFISCIGLFHVFIKLHSSCGFFFFQVLQTAQKEMLNYNNTGISVMGEK